jgi:hypothetical protein
VKSNLSVASFVTHSFNIISKKSLPNPMSWSFSLMFSETSILTILIALDLTERAWIHFQLIFHKVLAKTQTALFSMWVSSFSSTIYWSLFFHWMVLAALLKNHWLYMYGVNSGVSILLHGSSCLFLTSTASLLSIFFRENI